MLNKTFIIFATISIFLSVYVYNYLISVQPEQNTLGETTLVLDKLDTSNTNFVELNNFSEKLNYKITNGSVYYIAQKIWFNKPMENVKGITDELDGTGWIDFSDGSVYLQANIDLSKLDSGSPSRDSHNSDIFHNSTDATIVFELSESDIKLNKEFTIIADATFTINAITKDLPITITGLVTPQTFIASGHSETILIEEFDLTQISYAGLFGIGDEASFGFNVAGDLE